MMEVMNDDWGGKGIFFFASLEKSCIFAARKLEQNYKQSSNKQRVRRQKRRK